MKEIFLTQGQVAIVDDEDYEKVIRYKWFAHKLRNRFYAQSTGISNRNNREGKHIFMHNFILDTNKGHIVDHINRNGLDNRRSNLRKCSFQENACNRVWNNINKSSLYRGVSWSKAANKWKSQARSNTKVLYLGVFSNERKAAIAYDVAANYYYRNFAILNFPELIFWVSL